MKKFFRSIYFTARVYWLLGASILFFVLAYNFPILYFPAQLFFVALVVVVLAETLLLFRRLNMLDVRRNVADKLSNGDDNPIQILVTNFYPFSIKTTIIDEVPHQFQRRDLSFQTTVESSQTKEIKYYLRPNKRGAYHFGKLNIYVSSSLQLVERRFTYDFDIETAVYPSIIQMKKYELMAISNRLTDYGIKKIRRIGTNSEFDQIKEYVQGDDIRVVNWKATARRNKLMVNQFMDERSQAVYAVIDMGRLMKMPFQELSLLDYAINSSLVISNIALQKYDKAGLLTFSHKIHTILQAQRANNQLSSILEHLYKQETDFMESNFALLNIAVRRKINQRSLLLIYTNFESVSSMRRQLPYLKNLAKQHLVVTILFKNTEVEKLVKEKTKNLEDVYVTTIAEKYEFEKKQIVKELNLNGIQTILTRPQDLSVAVINKYLELKARGSI